MATTVASPIEHEESGKSLVTADEFLLMPKGVNKQELVDGEVIELSPVGGPHGRMQMRFGMYLGPHLQSTQQGEMYAELGFRFARNPDLVRAPDVCFISAEQLRARPMEDGFYDGYPDLAIEVTSRHDTVREVEDKVQTYFDAGTRLVWLVYPERRVVMVRYPDGRGRMLRSNDILSGEDVMPGFEITLDELFGK